MLQALFYEDKYGQPPQLQIQAPPCMALVEHEDCNALVELKRKRPKTGAVPSQHPRPTESRQRRVVGGQGETLAELPALSAPPHRFLSFPLQSEFCFFQLTSSFSVSSSSCKERTRSTLPLPLK
eukprot:RCo032285